MVSLITEENGLAQATVDGLTPKRSKRARVARRRAPVGSSKAKASKKPSPGKKATKPPKATSRKATREGSKTETILSLMHHFDVVCKGASGLPPPTTYPPVTSPSGLTYCTVITTGSSCATPTP